MELVSIGNGNIEIGEVVFSGYADNLVITVAGGNYTADTIEDGLKYNGDDTIAYPLDNLGCNLFDD